MRNNYSKTEHEEHFHKISEPIVDSWIHCESATKADLKKVGEILKIDPEDIQDSLDMMEIARIEHIERDVFVVYTRYPSMMEAGLYTTPLTVIVSEHHFVTICPKSSHLIHKILAQPSNIATRMRSKLLIDILSQIIQEFTRTVRQIRAEVINQEQDISQVSDEEIIELTKKEEKLNQCLNSLVPLKKVITDVLSGRYIALSEQNQENLEDVILSSEQAEDLCRLSIRIISSLRNSVQVIITNQFNKTIKLLTAMTIILNFPTMISSLYGMNVALPLEKNPFAFMIILSIISVICIIAVYLFQRRRWL